jgi:hypothetical protein
LKYVGYARGETVKVDSVAEVEKKNAELQGRVDALRRQSPN